ncbi:MAG: hypothetical protein HQK92_15215 [Nitrospirae bacterium]|nr:hypothetical protein [Nitrospirota bacterium]
MFEIKQKSIKNDWPFMDLPFITANYTDILYDEEPILFSGTNKDGNRILGSLVDEADTLGFFRFFHVFISEKTYIDFLNGMISYLEILKNEESKIFVVDRNYDTTIRDIFLIGFNEIPSGYVPLENSFCPEFEKNYSLDFVVSLKGKLADLKRALTKEISNIQTAFSKILISSIIPLKSLYPTPSIYQKAYSEGSFRLNFSIDFDDNRLLPVNKEYASQYVSKYLEYCMSYLHDEVNVIFKGEGIKAKNFEILKENLKTIYDSSSASLPENIEEIVKEELVVSADNFEKITENMGTNFTGMEFLNKSVDNENPIGFLDDKCKSYFTEIMKVIEESKVYDKDNEPKDYSICIYNLNTKTRKGNAHIIYNVGSDKEMSQPKIDITGNEPLDNSKFTESLHLNKWIDIKAKATRKGSKFIRLIIME